MLHPSSREIGKAQTAIDTYLQEQGAPERNSNLEQQRPGQTTG
ncbi:hypothetical protein [Scytonema sp. UIC 10036]|nr:hypothetical protein [Scytonema sp. UIC 10036]